MTDCAPQVRGLLLPPVDNEPWQKRARRAGLSQAELAILAGKRENAISEGLRGKGKGGVPTYLKTIIRLWELAPRVEKEAILLNPDCDPDD